LDLLGINRLQGFVAEDRVAEFSWRRRSKNEKPTRGDHASAEGDVTGINEEDFQKARLSLVAVRKCRVYQNPEPELSLVL
jgi:hypothetical protein